MKRFEMSKDDGSGHRSQGLLKELPKENNIYGIYNYFKDEEPFYTGACLAGLDTSKAWEIRNYLLRNCGLDGQRGVAQGLAGIKTEEAYRLRMEIMVEAPESVARGLAGNDSQEAWEIREKIKEKYLANEGVAEGLAESLAGLDSDRAWQLRNELIDKVLYNVFEGLVGLDSEKAWILRDEHKTDMLMSVANSLIGLNNERANKLREELAQQKESGKLALLISYVGSDFPEAWKLREELFKNQPFIVGTSLVGLRNQKAEVIREALMDRINQLKAGGTAENADEINKIRKGLLQGLNSNYINEALSKK